MNCASPYDHPKRRCLLHGDWNTHAKFETCPICGEKTDLVCNRDPTPTWKQSAEKAVEALKELADEAYRQQLEEAERWADRDRKISAAVSTLYFDFEAWLKADKHEVSAWANIQEEPEAYFASRAAQRERRR